MSEWQGMMGYVLGPLLGFRPSVLVCSVSGPLSSLSSQMACVKCKTIDFPLQSTLAFPCLPHKIKMFWSWRKEKTGKSSPAGSSIPVCQIHLMVTMYHQFWEFASTTLMGIFWGQGGPLSFILVSSVSVRCAYKEHAFYISNTFSLLPRCLCSQSLSSRDCQHDSPIASDFIY